MPKISVEIPGELLADLDEHVGDDGKFVNRSDAVRASIRKTLDVLDEIDARHDRLVAESAGSEDGTAGREGETDREGGDE
ncbi:ribbon-helix-helix domain-containing protein [Halorubrum laminariae]|uniref:Ribbon-helix-helix domain-containing protein n=2 Tax=Halorubrum TaxID=56688 RepID=A0ABD6BXP7_9EURY|nr:CopG family transcriptional regulator [Halorubrum laminariae]